MRKEVIENFTRSFFVGVVEISYFEMRGKRNIKISFNSLDDMKMSFKRAREARANELFLIDEDQLTFMADRDDYETAIYMTAVKGATEAWTMRFQEEAKERREALSNESDEDSDDSTGMANNS